MKKIIFLLCIINFLNASINQEDEFSKLKKCDADWLIVGAGPAGIATIGVLLDLGTLPQRITWVDPEYNVGRLSNYKSVDANTKNKKLLKFLESCKTFKDAVPDHIEKFKQLDPETEDILISIIEPLEVITKVLLKKINAIKGKMIALDFKNDVWNVIVEDAHENKNKLNLSAYHVVLATGSYPKRLYYDQYKDKEISLDYALDRQNLKYLVNNNDIVAVIGSAHSAILLLKYLTEVGVKKIYNFYNKPIQYPVDMGGWTLHEEVGIIGAAAYWAKNVLEKGLACHVERVFSCKENLDKILPICTKIIYAIGFERNELPEIKENKCLKYDPTNGTIGPRLFGIGIAFPEKCVNTIGNDVYKIGLPGFLEYAQRVVPTWVKKNTVSGYAKQRELLKSFEDLFNIEVL